LASAGRLEGQGSEGTVFEVTGGAEPVGSAEAAEAAEAAYVPRTLRADLTRWGRWPATGCVELGMGLARALAFLQEHGLVHRDVKPSNITFVGGVPKLADIGLVADVSDARSFVGTEGFIPPEGPGSPQADLYSLGKVLDEAATGNDRRDFPRLPDEGSDDPVLLELNAVVLKACKVEPGELGAQKGKHDPADRPA
jgi:serine/threonine protein kinase